MHNLALVPLLLSTEALVNYSCSLDNQSSAEGSENLSTDTVPSQVPKLKQDISWCGCKEFGQKVLAGEAQHWFRSQGPYVTCDWLMMGPLSHIPCTVLCSPALLGWSSWNSDQTLPASPDTRLRAPVLYIPLSAGTCSHLRVPRLSKLNLKPDNIHRDALIL